MYPVVDCGGGSGSGESEMRWQRGLSVRCWGQVEEEGRGVYCDAMIVNRLTAIRVPVGSKTPVLQDFYCRNSTKSTVTTNTTINKHHHHGGSVCPSYGVRSMDPPNLTRVTSLKGVGQGRVDWVYY